MEQRQFKRVHFLQSVEVKVDGQIYNTHCLDISLRGMLLVRPDGTNWQQGQQLQVTLNLSDEESICMECKLVHLDVDLMGVLCLQTDIDSLTSLRRLLEFNLANPQEINRELAELVHISI